MLERTDRESGVVSDARDVGVALGYSLCLLHVFWHAREGDPSSEGHPQREVGWSGCGWTRAGEQADGRGQELSVRLVVHVIDSNPLPAGPAEASTQRRATTSDEEKSVTRCTNRVLPSYIV